MLAISGDAPVDSVTLDSRSACPGSIFVASKGTSLDGHDFIGDALASGASIAVSRLDVFEGRSPAVLVENSNEATWRFSKQVYGDPSAKLKVIGVTGTNGKTTVAWVLRQALESLGQRTAYMGTLGAFVGQECIDTGLTTPFSPEINEFLARCANDGVDALTMEVSSHALAQKRVDGVEFDVAVFTNLSHDHLDFHTDFADYFAAKERLFFDLPSRKELKSVLNVDDPFGAQIARKIGGAITFGDTGAVKLMEAHPGLDSLRMQVAYSGQKWEITAPLGARFNVSNSMAVLSALLALGYSPADSSRALASVSAAPGRFEPVENGRGVSVIVDYAHTPDALEKVLLSASELTGGRLICVFGCGGDRDKDKRPKMASAASSIASIVWVTSDNPRTEDPESIIADILPGLVPATESRVEPDRRKAIFGAIAEARPGDCVVVAGKGHEDYQIIGKEKTHFDDREVAAEALA
ncbi:MAG: UDP-N-acetylmuramoyl-L-alanyl-D-glutamate--2,6-diaminopimelate ligase [Armatimonadota bacterium]|nr:UDP-N-acetylmuramoyl-L-alanyl-D-glutamate--2,6-diaminopimelate ligase [Armatimonadota bacterium]